MVRVTVGWRWDESVTALGLLRRVRRESAQGCVSRMLHRRAYTGPIRAVGRNGPAGGLGIVGGRDVRMHRASVTNRRGS